MEKSEMMKKFEAETGESLEEAKERCKTFAFYSRYIAWLEAQLTWRPASELPEEDQVIATYLNQCGYRRRVMAVYIRQYEEEAGVDDESCVEYCEEQDELYLREGWYELIDNLGDYSSVAIVEGVVDYWMPVPPAPDTVSDGRGGNMNAGKQFEKDFKASVLDDQFYLRLKDAGGWSKSADLRFTPSQLCDCLLFTRGTLYLLELKLHTGKSIPASCLKQTDALATVDYVGTFPAFVCNFRDYSETYLIGAYFVQQELSVRKSLSLETCRELGVRIPQTKLRIHWRYDLSVL